ncbi:AEC family transporter [Bauldia sp.]|uniref:AEC family transporter n=1 Tax=Bauldia sp. TaxID=2575872 RepID=UPI003BABC21A
MNQIATIVLPFLGLIACGFGAGRTFALPANGLDKLIVFAKYFALPAWFFILVADTPFSDVPDLSFVITTTFATYCAFALAFSFGALINGGNVPEATVKGLISSYSNIGYIAPALVVVAFGPTAAAPAALILVFDGALLFALVPLMMILGGVESGGASAMARAILRRIFTHPLVIATLAGLAFSATGLPIPDPIGAVFTVLSGAAAPVALFAVGLSLAERGNSGFSADVPVLLVGKLVIHPIIVYLLLAWIGGFDPVWVATAVLVAALPPATAVIDFAERYQAEESNARAAVRYGTAASLVTVTVVLYLLVADFVPQDFFR